MNLILLPKELEQQPQIKVSGYQRDHMTRVLRLKKQSLVKVGFINGGVYSYEYLGEEDTGSCLKFKKSLDLKEKNWGEEIPVQVVLALPRPKNLGRILESIVSLGVPSIHIIHSYHVEKSFWQSERLNKESIDHSIRLGLEQSVRTKWPKLTFHRWFRPFAEDTLPGLLSQTPGYLAHPYESQPLGSISSGSEFRKGLVGTKTLIIGPERGFIDFEVKMMEEAGAKRFSLGSSILKVEVALIRGITQLESLSSL